MGCRIEIAAGLRAPCAMSAAPTNPTAQETFLDFKMPVVARLLAVLTGPCFGWPRFRPLENVKVELIIKVLPLLSVVIINHHYRLTVDLHLSVPAIP